MELYGAKKCFEKLHQEDLDISSFVSDRLTGIAKWIQTDEKSTQHYAQFAKSWQVLVKKRVWKGYHIG